MKPLQVGARASALFAISAPASVACLLHVVHRGAAVLRAGESSLDELMGAAALVGIWAVIGWAAGTVALSAAGALPGAAGAAAVRLSAAVTPRAVQRMVVLAIGVTVAGGAAPAFASTTPGPASGTAAVAATTPRLMTISTGMTVAEPGAVGDLAQASFAGSFDNPSRVTGDDWPPLDRPTTQNVLVERGDCLWTIAAEHLAPHSTAAEIAAEWPRWYAANRVLIGPDPDLIRPGQYLDVPGTP